MAKKAKNYRPEPTEEKPKSESTVELSGLPGKDLFRVEEVAQYFNIARSTVYLWIDHGILTAEKYHGTLRVPRESILNCRLSGQLRPLE